MLSEESKSIISNDKLLLAYTSGFKIEVTEKDRNLIANTDFLSRYCRTKQNGPIMFSTCSGKFYLEIFYFSIEKINGVPYLIDHSFERGKINTDLTNFEYLIKNISFLTLIGDTSSIKDFSNLTSPVYYKYTTEIYDYCKLCELTNTFPFHFYLHKEKCSDKEKADFLLKIILELDVLRSNKDVQFMLENLSKIANGDGKSLKRPLEGGEEGKEDPQKRICL